MKNRIDKSDTVTGISLFFLLTVYTGFIQYAVEISSVLSDPEKVVTELLTASCPLSISSSWLKFEYLPPYLLMFLIGANRRDTFTLRAFQ